MEALKLLKECKELLLDVTIEKNGETAKTGILWLEKFDEAIAEIEAFQEENKILKHNYDVQVEYNNTAYKNYTNMVNSLEQRIEAMKPKSCEGCKYDAEEMSKECYMCSRNVQDQYEPKDKQCGL